MTENNEFKLKFAEFAIFEDRATYLNPSRMFFAYFGCLPNNIFVAEVNQKKVKEWLEREHAALIRKKHSRRTFTPNDKEGVYTDVYYLFENKMLIKVDKWNDVLILYCETSEALANEIVVNIRKFRIHAGPSLYTLVEGGKGLQLTSIKCKKPKLSINAHYNDDFDPVHKKMLKELKSKDKSGLFLLHGAPGTGKSTYIKYIIHYLRKNIIFLPPNIAAKLDSPELVGILIEQPNSVFIIEDAENIISSREQGLNSSISMLLNLTDGILGESLGIQFICTFNTSLKNIDKALLRKGRLKMIYEFKTLAPRKVYSLMTKLGNPLPHMREDMTLADIYNYEDNGITAENKKVIGFSYVK